MRGNSFFIRFIAIGILFHVYVWVRIIPYVFQSLTLRFVSLFIFVGFCCVIPVGLMARRLDSGRAMKMIIWGGLLAMGFFSSLLILTFLREFFLLTIYLLRFIFRERMWSTVHQDTAEAVIFLAVLLSIAGFWAARRRAPVKRVNIPIKNLPEQLEGVRIVQLTDIHVGPTIGRAYVQRIVDAVNTLQADVVAITGDVVDGPVARLSKDTYPLSELVSRHGTYLVTGNHEYYAGAHEWISEFERIGIKVLINEHVVINHNGERVVVAGVTDYGAGQYDPKHLSSPAAAISGAPDDIEIKILLAHQPRSAEKASEVGFSLQLSGHTHGGQFVPWMLFVRLQQPVISGLTKINDLWVYTSRGTGYWGPPNRFGAPSEITLINLTRERSANAM